MAETYNGWSNRETWAVGLHIDNEPGTYSLRGDWVTEAREIYEEDYEHDERVGHVAESVRVFIEEAAENVTHDPENACQWDRMMLADVGSTRRVDWYEIAENWLSEE